MTIAPASRRRPTRVTTRAPAATLPLHAPVVHAPVVPAGTGDGDGAQGDPTWDAAWASALARVELDADEVEAMLARLHAEPDHVPAVPARWTSPPRLGPLPASMAIRAEAVLKRHQRLAEELTVAITENRRQRRAAASLSQREAAAPVYIDTEA